MIKIRVYFRSQLKRSISLYPIILLVTVITAIAMIAGVYYILSDTVGTEDNQKIKVGIVGNIDDTSLGSGIDMVKNIDSSRFSIELCRMSRQEAHRALMNDEIHGYMDIPDNFIEGIMHGENHPASYVVKKGALNFGSVITGEIATSVSDWVIKSQSSIYSMHDIAEEYSLTTGIGKKNRALNYKYIKTVTNRDKIYDIETVGVYDNLGLKAYYLCSLIMLMLMFWGISCFGIFAKKDNSFSKLLTSRGVNPFCQIISELLSFFVVTMITVVLFAVIFYVVLINYDIGITEISASGITDFIAFIVKISVLVFMVCSMHVFIYEAVPNQVGAILLQFIVTIGLGYLSGLFYPNYFFPDSIQKLASYLPAGVGFSYLGKCLNHGEPLSDLWMMVVYSAIFVLGGSIIRNYKTTGDSR